MREARRTSSAELDQSELDILRSWRLAGPEIKSDLLNDVTTESMSDDGLPRYARIGQNHMISGNTVFACVEYAFDSVALRASDLKGLIFLLMIPMTCRVQIRPCHLPRKLASITLIMSS